jgi:hypothetical protein
VRNRLYSQDTNTSQYTQWYRLNHTNENLQLIFFFFRYDQTLVYRAYYEVGVSICCWLSHIFLGSNGDCNDRLICETKSDNNLVACKYGHDFAYVQPKVFR